MTAISTAGNKVFVDTGAFIALAFRGDQLHFRAVAIHQALLRQGVALFSSNLIIAETYTFLRYNVSYHAALGFLKNLKSAERNGMITIIYATPQLDESALAILEKFCDQDLSFVDAVSFAILEQDRRLQDVFTFDAHFHLIQRNVLQ